MSLSTAMEELAIDWLKTPFEQRQAWLTAHRHAITLPFLEYLRQQCADKIRSLPREVDQISQSLFSIADFLANEPMAQAIACWARGIWAAYYDPAQAVLLYQRALHICRPLGNPQHIVRLLSNSLPPLFDTGDFSTAHQAYEEAMRYQNELAPEDRKYLLGLMQNYGLLLDRQGRYQEALAVHLQARSIAQDYQLFYKMVELDVNRVLTLANMGQLSGAVELLKQSRQVAQQYGQSLTLARIDMNLGEIFTAQGVPSEALQYFQSARDRFSQLGNQMELSSVTLREAALLERLGAFLEARQKYTEVYQHFLTLGMKEQAAHALLRCAIANRLYGGKRQLHEAQRLLDEAETIWGSVEHVSETGTVRLEKIALMLAKGSLAQAQQCLQRWFDPPPDPLQMPLQYLQYQLRVAETYEVLWQQTQNRSHLSMSESAYEIVLDAGDQQNNPYLQRQALAGLGRLKLVSSPHQAQKLLERAVQQDELIRQSLSIEELRSSFLEQSSDILPLLVDLAVQQGESFAALQYAWQAKGNALVELLNNKLGAEKDTIAISPQLDSEISLVRLELARRRWQTIHHAEMNIPATVLESQDGEIAHLMQKLQTLRRQRNTKLDQPLANREQQPLHLLQSMAADLLIEYICCDDQLLAICADRDGNCHSVRLASITTIEELAESLQRKWQVLANELWSVCLAQQFEECLAILHELYQRLIAPLGALKDESHLLIAPCAPLYTLPFAAFWNGRRYLIEEFTIEQIITGGLFAVPHWPSANGNPLLIASSANGFLPATQAEVLAIQSYFPEATLLVDDLNTIAHLQSLQLPPRLLHIAAHTHLMAGATSSSSLLFRALDLPGGLFSVEQCFDLTLRGCELVTLSGCSTATGLDSGGSLIAFQSAFLLAGANRVLTTLWSIPDSTATEWMRCFYQFIASGASPAVAIRRTQQAWIQNPHYCHPALWAAYVVNRR